MNYILGPDDTPVQDALNRPDEPPAPLDHGNLRRSYTGFEDHTIRSVRGHAEPRVGNRGTMYAVLEIQLDIHSDASVVEIRISEEELSYIQDILLDARAEHASLCRLVNDGADEMLRMLAAPPPPEEWTDA